MRYCSFKPESASLVFVSKPGTSTCAGFFYAREGERSAGRKDLCAGNNCVKIDLDQVILYIWSMSSEFVIQPNRSLSDRGRKRLLYGVGLIMALITLRFVLIGGWMVVPFMLADIVALVLAFVVVGRQCCIVERVVIEGDLLTIHHEEKHKPLCWSFPLYWVNVDLKPGPHPSHGSRLLIGSHGEWIELAGFLTNAERESLTEAIREAVHEALSLNKEGCQSA